jgi:hypothetical protein
MPSADSYPTLRFPTPEETLIDNAARTCRIGGMTPDENEHTHAQYLVQFAQAYARKHFPNDVDAAAAAMLVRAVELATPELSPDSRAALFSN